MIEHVRFEHTTYNTLPYKFEAGTPDYVATHGLATAIDYVESIGLEAIRRHEQDLTRYCIEQLTAIDGSHVYGPSVDLLPVPDAGVKPLEPGMDVQHDAVVSFNVGNIHHLDIGTLLDRLGIAVRTGHHCAQPLMDRLGIPGTVRASFALYNTKEEVDVLVAGIKRVSQMF